MLDFIKEKQDVWQILQLTDKPVVLYGMGNGADPVSYTHLDVYKRQSFLK